jgi:hypothetical protein
MSYIGASLTEMKGRFKGLLRSLNAVATSVFTHASAPAQNRGII